MQASYQSLNTHIQRIQNENPPVNEKTGLPTNDRLLGAIIVINPQNGETLSMVSGTGKDDGPDDDRIAINALSPPASTCKPWFVCFALSNARLKNGEPYTVSSIINPKDGRVGTWLIAVSAPRVVLELV
jgi:membrane peptidoglycan carboxypeptidase